MPKPASDLPITEVSPAPELEKRTRRVFSTDDKLRILAEAERCARGEPYGSTPTRSVPIQA